MEITPNTPAPKVPVHEPKLTFRQRQALALMASGLSYADAGKIMGISDRTVNKHIENSVVRLKAKHRAHAVFIAMATGELQAELG